MAKPGADGGAPVTEGEPAGVRFPEDELEKLESEAGSDEQAGEGETPEDAEEAARKAEDASVEKLQGFMVKKGIKSVADLVDFAAGLESRVTKLTQDNQRLSAGTQAGFLPMGQVKEEPEKDEPLAMPANMLEFATDPEKAKAFFEAFEKRIVARVERKYAKAKANETAGDLQRQVEAKRIADPAKFDRLKSTMIELAGTRNWESLDALYQAAEEKFTADRKALAADVMAELGYKPSDLAGLKSVLHRIRPVIPGGTGAQVDPARDAAKKADADLLKAIVESDKF